MQRRTLGNSQLEVSLLCLGSMTFGEQNSLAEAKEQLNYATEQGINFIDCAEMYPVPPRPETQGDTETHIGHWLAERGQRDDVVIASKVSGPADWLAHVRGGPKLIAEHINQACDESLKRLQTDYIDLYQVHWPARNTNYFGKLGYQAADDAETTPIEETLSALAALQTAGKIRHIGVSNETAWGIAEYLRCSKALGIDDIVSVQNPYNLLNRTFEVGMAEFSHRNQVGLLAYSPLAFGVLSGKYLGGARPAGARLTLYDRFTRYTGKIAEQTTQDYADLAQAVGLDLAQMALAFINSRSFITSNIIGATNMEQLRSNIASASLELDSEVIKAINAIHEQQPNPCP